jgi:hypothetical protein
LEEGFLPLFIVKGVFNSRTLKDGQKTVITQFLNIGVIVKFEGLVVKKIDVKDIHIILLVTFLCAGEIVEVSYSSSPSCAGEIVKVVKAIVK